MDTTTYIGISHQSALRRHMDLIANNIANMNTTAYRREQVTFRQYLVDLGSAVNRDIRKVAFVEDYGISRDSRQGSFTPTGNPLDVAIEGNGFFSVQEDGATDVLYTRNGRFSISADGFLALESGHKILSSDGQPIPITPGDAEISISTDGVLSSGRGAIGQISVVEFANDALLQKAGDTLFSTQQEAIPAADYKLQNGMLESSNVNAINEMTQMIDVLRSYQSTSKMLDRYQDLRSRGIEQLGRVQ